MTEPNALIVPTPPSGNEASTTIGPLSLSALEGIVNGYYPGLGPTFKAALAVFGCMALKGRTLPVSVVFETPSGFGKSTTVQFFFPTDDGKLKEFVYRSDRFTPKAFVSHAANVSSNRLAKNDLLPKLPNKVLLTKELAPIFRGREEDMKENFAILISVLDGRGYVSDSGVHGQRGCEHSIVFNWIGATTPLPVHTHRLMAQLGTRLLFYEVPAIRPSRESLVQYAERENYAEASDECQRLANAFVLDFFSRHPISSVDPESITIPASLLGQLVGWAEFLSMARAEVKCERVDKNTWEPVSAAPGEGPYKLIQYFKSLARGHALVHDRYEANDEDLRFIAHIAISSIPGHLRPLVRELIRCGVADSTKATELCGVTQPTARRYLKELALLGIGELKKGTPATNESDTLALTETLKDWCGVRIGKDEVLESTGLSQGTPILQGGEMPAVAFRGLNFAVTERQDRALSEAFPWVDRQFEYRKMDSWYESRGRKPKRVSEAIHNWFSKVQKPTDPMPPRKIVEL